MSKKCILLFTSVVYGAITHASTGSSAAKPQTTTPTQTLCSTLSNSMPPKSYITTTILNPASYADRITTQDPSTTQLPSGLSTKQVAKLLKNPATPATQKVALISQRNTALDGSSMKITPKTKNRTTAASRAVSQGSLTSFTQSKRTLNAANINFPDSATQQAYNAFISSLQTNPTFIPLFRKLHIVALNEIYQYLLGIYTALTMTHIDDLKTYISTEKTYALNKKTLIITHLVNVIQAQLNSALQALFPGIPETYAIKSGMGAIEQDNGSNLNTLVINLEQSVMAVMGISTLSQQQVGDTINELLVHLPGGSAKPTFTDASLAASITNAGLMGGTASLADLQSAITVMQNQGSSFITNLSATQTRALVGAFNILLASYATTQTAQNLKAILKSLNDPSASLTSAQFNAFKTLVGQFATGQQLTAQLASAQQFEQLLTSKSATPFTTDQQQVLQSIIAYVLQNYEEQSLDGVNSLVKKLGQLNPAAQQLSVLDSLTLQPIAAQLLGLNNQQKIDLASLTDSQRFLLAYALGVIAQQPTSNTLQATLNALSQSLNNAPLTTADLTSAQSTALTKALQQLANYQMTPLNAQDVGNDLTPTEVPLAQSALSKINTPGFTSFSTLTSQEQLVALKLFQEMSRVMETRLVIHRKQSSLLMALFGGNTKLQTALFNSISADQYQALSFLDKQLASGTAISPAQLATQQVTTPDGVTLSLTVSDALLPMFSQKTTNATPSYYSILVQLGQQFFNDPALQIVIKTISPTDTTLYQTVINQMTNQNFTMQQISSATKASLTKTITNYLEQKTAPNAQQSTAPVAFQDTTQEAVNVVANTLFYTHVFKQGRSNFLVTLNLYLHFFNLYTQTLQTPAQPTYTGLSTFENLAQQISQQLADTPTDSLNPPLFFFNDATFRGIRLLPKLAQLVDGTQPAPYPTFSIELAINGSALDPSLGQTYQNTQTTGPVTYNKFFFLDPSQSSPTVQQQIEQGIIPAPELTGYLPSWITKVSVSTAQQSSYQYLYIPNTELTGITGFYMNIPTFEPDPNNSKSSLIRLYEQPVIAQPAWLSVSGWPSVTSSGSSSSTTLSTPNTPSILTVLRGCLGDFQSLLTIDLFDPCLTLIFTYALNLESATQTDTSALTDACTNYISEKLADQQRQTSVQGAASNISITNQQTVNQGAL